ncbi:hypothetical protein PI124_g21214 [Phytophthora idaei]|nr:hypothetical protein PI125_g22468 [Phytophthora idaei]KAG3166577.1 hypothetical protein PI126_g4129 [Phytophthora idaei]KAG3233717.1 hypothetical protein PI124_g21214 [Phytophthora idaei]
MVKRKKKDASTSTTKRRRSARATQFTESSLPAPSVSSNEQVNTECAGDGANNRVRGHRGDAARVRGQSNDAADALSSVPGESSTAPTTETAGLKQASASVAVVDLGEVQANDARVDESSSRVRDSRYEP